MKKIKVLIVDDSALIRQSLTTILNADPEIEVAGTAADPYIAVKQIQKISPDVITLDLQMPRMDGLTFLKRLMGQHPIPVVVISSITTEGSRTAMKAMEYGAVSVLQKPNLSLDDTLKDDIIRICDAVKAASQARLPEMNGILSMNLPPEPSAGSGNRTDNQTTHKKSSQIIVIGASVGGTEALKVILRGLPPDGPGIVVVQHMPSAFTKIYAEGLDKQFGLTIKEARDGDIVTNGSVLIAEGDHHLLLNKRGDHFYVKWQKGELVNRHRPSVDRLFQTTAAVAGPNAAGIILTGMGNDGARGLLEMRQAGAYTIAQDEETCVVYGMPREAVRLGAANIILPLHQIASHVMRHIQQKNIQTF